MGRGYGAAGRLAAVCAAFVFALAMACGIAGCDTAATGEVAAATDQAEWELARMTTAKAGTLANGVYGALGSFATGGDLAKAYIQKVTYEVGDVTVSGKTATADVTLTCPDYAWVSNRALSIVRSDYTTPASLTADALGQKAGEAMAAALDQDDVATKKYEVKLTLEKVGDSWVADDEAVRTVGLALWDGAVACKDGAWSYTDQGKMQLAQMWVALLAELADDPSFFAQAFGLDADIEAELEACGWSAEDYYKAVLGQAEVSVGKTTVVDGTVSTVLHVTALDGSRGMATASEAAMEYSQTQEAQELYRSQGEGAVQHEAYGVLFDHLASDRDSAYQKDITLDITYSGQTAQLDADAASQYVAMLAGQGTADQ